jgi:hypothetical protein
VILVLFFVKDTANAGLFAAAAAAAATVPMWG